MDKINRTRKAGKASARLRTATANKRHKGIRAAYSYLLSHPKTKVKGFDFLHDPNNARKGFVIEAGHIITATSRTGAIKYLADFTGLTVRRLYQILPHEAPAPAATQHRSYQEQQLFEFISSK